MKNPFEGRAVSSFGISIGTGLSLESVFLPTTPRYDPKREIPIIIKPTDYKIHYYNVFTLIRNILSSTSETNKILLMNNQFLLPTLIEEIELINLLYEDLAIKAVLYVPDYKDKHKRFNTGKENILTNSYLDIEAVKSKLVGIEKVVSMEVIVSKGTLPGTNETVLMFSSYLLDFLNLKNVPNMSLLESHTGKIKSKGFLNTKYHPIGKADLSIFPFMDILLFILGDKTLVKCSKISLRKHLYEIAVERNWNIKTTREKVMSDIKKSDILREYISNFN